MAQIFPTKVAMLPKANNVLHLADIGWPILDLQFLSPHVGNTSVQVCREAGVPLKVVPLTEQYWQRVVSHCLDEIRAGRTPNPDILCNSRCLFSVLSVKSNG